MYVGGIDWGRHSDYTSAIRLAARPNKLLIDRFVRLKNGPWDEIVATVAPIVAGSSRVLSDGTGVGDALTDRIPNATGVIIVSSSRGRRLTQNRISVGATSLIQPLVLAVNTGVLEAHCPAPELEAELKQFVVKFTSKKGSPRFEARQGHDDTVYALALAIYAARGDLYVNKSAA